MDLRERHDRLSSIAEIVKLKNLYWQYNDTGLLGDKIAELFTEDGIWSNEQLGHYQGREEICDFFNGLPPALPFCAHLGMNPIVEVAGDEATASWRALLTGTFVEEGEPVSRLILIDYADAYARLGDRWFVRKMDILFNFDVKMGESWVGKETIRTGA